MRRKASAVDTASEFGVLFTVQMIDDFYSSNQNYRRFNESHLSPEDIF
jgi:hypothetical protein